MKNQLTLLTAVIFSTLALTGKDALGMGGTTVEIKGVIIGVQTCLGGGSCNQTQTTNAIGATFNADPKTASFTDLGTITSTTGKNLQVPAKAGDRSLYSFTTEDGKKVYLGLEMKTAPQAGKRYHTIENPQDKRMLTAGKDFNVVELYRYDDAKQVWLRNDVIFVQANKTAELPVIISADGSLLVGQFTSAE